jgi:hypothetical protein
MVGGVGKDCRFQFQKSSQLFIRPHNETLSVGVSDPLGLVESDKKASRCRPMSGPHQQRTRI